MSNIDITEKQLKYISDGYGSQEILDGLIKFLPQYLPGYQINTNYRLAAFLANACEETANFKTLVEYGDEEYFTRYDGREDLGNTEPGDGYRFRGRGIFQLTGRANYKIYGDKIEEDLITNPDKAETPEIAVNLACEYWDDHNLSELADSQNFREIVKKINGGFNGYETRWQMYQRALEVTPQMIIS